MSTPISNAQLVGRWFHSFEEDSDAMLTFRSAEFRFPPSRGRTGFDLRADGTMLAIGIGPTDKPTETKGTWRLMPGNILDFDVPVGPTAARSFRIVALERERLVVSAQSR
jgi:hypothetical protein